MDPAEEQAQELEVLQSIYPDELEVLSPHRFTIIIDLDTESDRKHRLALDVTYPPQYPEVAPELHISLLDTATDEQDSDDDDSDDDSNKVIHIAETIAFEREDLRILSQKLSQEAEANLGMPSVFALVSQLKEEAEQHFRNKVAIAQRLHDAEQLKQEQQEQQKFTGTKVTRESFQEWRARFREEMHIAERDKARFDAMHHGKMTGREIFEKGLAAGIEDEDDLVDAVKAVQV